MQLRKRQILRNHPWPIGFIGINEACEIQGYDILDEQGSKFAKRILDKINDLNFQKTKVKSVQQTSGITTNSEIE